MEIITKSANETVELGRKIGNMLKGGEVLSLIGNLGSGKTHLVKGIAAGADALDENAVHSPTFVLVNEYFGRLDIYHIDAYRLNNEKQFEQLGFDDMCYPNSVVIIEWADKVSNILGKIRTINISLEYIEKNSRKIIFENIPSYLVL